MKSRFFKTAVGVFVFLLIFILSLYVMTPVYRTIDSMMHSAEEQFLSEFSSSTNLGVTYDSLSPSILTGIHINNIRVFEISTGEEILSIKKISIGYNVLNLVRKDFEHVFSKVIVSGVQVNLNKDKVLSIKDKLRDRKSNSNSETVKIEVEDGKVLNEKQQALIKKVISIIPPEIIIKDISFIYNDLKKSVSAKINKINLHKQEDGNISVDCNNAYALAVISSLKTKTIGARFSFNGKIIPGFSGSSMIVSLNQYKNADFSIFKTQFLIHYRDDCVYLHSTQMLQPYKVSAKYNISEGDFSADLDLKDLIVSKVVKFSINKNKLKDLINSGISFKGNVSANFGKKIYSWSGEGGLSLPESIIHGGEILRFDAKGDNKKILIKSFSAKGDFLEAYISGMYDFEIKKPSGNINLVRLTLPNGNDISADVYVEAENGLVQAFTPQIFLGNQKFTALNITAKPSKGKIPFTFEIGDYSHSDYEKPAEVKIKGIYKTGSEKNLSASISIDSLFLDSIVKAGAFFVKKEKQEKFNSIAKKLSPFITSDEFSFSTDFKQVSFNSPFALLANTKKQNQMAFFAFDGNERSVNVSDFNIILGKHTVKAKFGVDVSPEEKQATFTSSFDINNIPYQFYGVYTLKKWLSVKGSYGIDIIANLENGINGSANITSLPIAVSNLLFKVSTESIFRINNINDFLVDLKSFQVELDEKKLSRSPKLAFIGSIDPDGLVFESINFSDVSTSSSGSGYVRWNLIDGTLESVNSSVALGNELTSEVFSLDGSFSNPTHVKLTKDSVIKDCYFNATAQIKNFPLMRLVPKQYADDTFNGTVLASGTFENPYVSVNIDSLSAQYGTKPVIVNGRAELIEGNASIPFFNLSWGNIKVDNLKADLDLKKFNGNATAGLSIRVLGGRVVQIPLDIALVNTDKEKTKANGKRKYVPEKFIVTGNSSVTAKGLINGSIPVHAEVTKEGKVISFKSDDSKGVKGSYILKEGTFKCDIPNEKPFHGSASGLVRKGKVDLTVKNIFCNLEKFKELVSSDYFAVYDGILSGQVEVTGMTSDPTLNGALLARNFEFSLPLAIPKHLKAKNMLITLDDNKIEIPESKFNIDGNNLALTSVLVLDRWSVSSFNLNANTLKDDSIPINMNVPNVGIKGNASAKFAIDYTGRVLSLDVKGTMNNSDLHILNNKLPFNSKSKKSEDPEKESFFTSLTRTMDVQINVDAKIGRKVDIVIDPIIRALVTPNTKLNFNLDSSKGVWTLKSDVVLRGGQISYLSRNFYIKQGRIVLNESQNGFNPYITVNAETRERDENNIPVTIVLSAEHQPLSNFTGRIYSIPARSEAQIMSMLGQIITGDSDNVGSLFISGIDYGMHLTLLRKMENSLRDLFNFDIFSIRLNVFQNSLKYGLSSGTASDSEGTVFRNPIGNYLDNSSVYIGKYFGSTVYADVLLQWTYDETVAKRSKYAGSGLIFHPEIGVEFDAPFANIRWNFAPDLTALHNGEVPSIVSGTSVTLSWRITF